MTNEFGIDGTSDKAWELLRANDPANSAANPDLAAIRASVLAETNKVVPISKRSWLAPVAVAASVALFVGGGAGFTIAAPIAIGSAQPRVPNPNGANHERAVSHAMTVWAAYASCVESTATIVLFGIICSIASIHGSRSWRTPAREANRKFVAREDPLFDDETPRFFSSC